MVTEIILILSIPLTLLIGCYFTLQAFKLGQKTEVKEVVEENFEPLQVSEEKQKHFQEMIDEYMGN